VQLDGIDDVPIILRVAHPLAFLWLLYTSSEKFADFHDKRHALIPSSDNDPWRVCVYSDEVTPGNPLQVDVARKVQVIYWSFLEFGPAALAREDLWFLVTPRRSGAVSKIQGEMAQIFGAILKLMFVDACGTLHSCGITLKRAGQPAIHLYGKLACFVQDGGAHKVTWHCKGDSGTKHCLLCKNIFTEKSKLLEEDGTEALRCNVIRHAELQLASDAELKFAVRRLNAFRAIDDPDTFIFRSMALGFRHMPYNMLSDLELDDVIAPASQFMHDWMHCIFVSGVWNHVMDLLLESLKEAGIARPYDLFYNYIKQWHWPGRLKMNKVFEVFAHKRREGNRKAKYFKCSASE
jgi:hypothetical protein